MDGVSLIDRIGQRQADLKAAAAKLKEHFVGLDAVIDKITASIEAWYCLPEIMNRPTIVCLWGLTGIGKTDLVRRLVKALRFEDNFVEIQLTNKGSSQHGSSVTSLQSLLYNSNVSPEEPGILLLDEIQRFRSVDQEGKDIHDYVFQDLWMLLSDGSFGSASDNKQQIVELLLDAIYWQDYYRVQKQTAKASDEDLEDEIQEREMEKRRKFKQTYYHAKQLKRKLRLPESVEAIMEWDGNKKIDMLQNALEGKTAFLPEVYGRMLIFISGNLDEAYAMADETDETDIDADLFHKRSLRVNMLTVKEALTQRFKPEQIARFGNTHVVYPALSRASYEEIIRRKIRESLGGVTKASGVSFNCAQSVFDAIYRNGVFPVQGTRPVFSTISSFFDCMLPTFTLKALTAGQKEVELHYAAKHLCATISGELARIRNEGDIDRIKEEKENKHELRKIAVHEAGHAVAYASLFGLVPTQLSVQTADDDKAGFVGTHLIETTREHLLWQIQVSMAGRAAEQIFFGEGLVNGGAISDIDKATSLAALYVRCYGMGRHLTRVDTETSSNACQRNLDIDPTNDEIEAIVQEQKAAVAILLKDKMPLLVSLADHLAKYRKVSDRKFIMLCKAHGVGCTTLDAKEMVRPRYADLYAEYNGGRP